jgi:hypothetical protein
MIDQISKTGFAVLLLHIVWVTPIFAQAHIKGTPLTIERPSIRLPATSIFSLPALDNRTLATYADSIAGTLNCESCKNNFYGKGVDMAIDIKKSGLLEMQPDGSKLWLLKISSPSAFGMQFYFNKFRLPFGATLFFYNEDKTMILGAFTSENNPDTTLAVPFGTQWIEGKTIYVEYFEPFYADFGGELAISNIVHIYQDVFFRSGPFNFDPLGPCHVNVACPEGLNWVKERNSVALILFYDTNNKLSSWCSGAVINNTENDGRPLFLTASHCLRINPTPNPALDYRSWVFLFNHQAPNCNSSGSNVSNSTTQSVYGSKLLAADDYLNITSDYALLELNTSREILSSYGVCYAGWDRSGLPGNPPYACIQHPKGDIKKISIENDPVVSTAPQSSTMNPSADFWRVVDWDKGITAGGSSGSPLFNGSHRIIGQLCCGLSECAGTGDNGMSDWYGKFSKSWGYGGLGYWLNPFSAAQNTVDTYCPAYCNDGVQNGDETGVDCGGLSCPPCPPTSGGGICRTVQFTVNNKNTTSKIINVCDPNVVLTPYSYNEGSCANITAAAHWQHITTIRDTWCDKITDRGEAAYLSKHFLDQKCYCKFYKLFIGIQECDENKNLIGTGKSHWFNIYDGDQNNDWDALNLYSFHLYDHMPGGFTMQQGKYYAIKIASYGSGVVNASNWKEYTSYIRVYKDNLLIQNKSITHHQFANTITIDNSNVPATANVKVVAKTRIEILPKTTLESGTYYIDNFDCNNLDQFSQ